MSDKYDKAIIEMLQSLDEETKRKLYLIAMNFYSRRMVERREGN